MWASVWIYYAAQGSAKCSILLQYLRIFPNTKFRMACYGMLGVTAMYVVLSRLPSATSNQWDAAQISFRYLQAAGDVLLY